MDNVIYTPKGKAREYSPYALNVYTGCDHGCKYCYIKQFYVNNKEVKQRNNLIAKLENQLKKNKINEQTLLCFIGDPYCKADSEYKTTREALKILLKYNVPTAILSKGGKRILRDLDLFKKFKNIKVGTTLTLLKEKESLFYEPGAALPEERIKVLNVLHDEGIKTWISFEPVIDPLQTYKLLELSYPFIDQYKVGKMNHYRLPHEVNWREFGDTISERLLELRKDFYIKKDLYYFMNKKLEDKYINQDYLTLRNIEENIIIKKEIIMQPALF